LKALHILGGGLAGLSLARGLAAQGIPVTVYEKIHYPRHKVCGEFITGLDRSTIDRLELGSIFKGALIHKRTAWYFRDQLLFRRTLPAPAIGLSRWTLDARLAASARECGAEIREGTGVIQLAPEHGESWVCATGVPRTSGRSSEGPRWLGLKAHFSGVQTTEDLELHLGVRAYAGLSAIENGRVNVCMLLDTRGHPAAEVHSLEKALHSVGLIALAERLKMAQADPASRVATAGMALTTPRQVGKVIALGDSLGMIPPFTGHGMALAFKSAARALKPLIAYSSGACDWSTARQSLLGQNTTTHNRRIRYARLLHPLLLLPGWQRVAAGFAASPVFPWRLLYGLTH
jgi:flavin-dependent dehydrogenase